MIQRGHACCARFVHVDMGSKRPSGGGAVSTSGEKARALVVRTIQHFDPQRSNPFGDEPDRRGADTEFITREPQMTPLVTVKSLRMIIKCQQTCFTQRSSSNVDVPSIFWRQRGEVIHKCCHKVLHCAFCIMKTRTTPRHLPVSLEMKKRR